MQFTNIHKLIWVLKNTQSAQQSVGTQYELINHSYLFVPSTKKSETKRLGDINNNLQKAATIKNSEHNFLYIKPIITINPVGF